MIDQSKLPANWGKLTNYEKACWLVENRLVLSMKDAGKVVNYQLRSQTRSYSGIGLATAKQVNIRGVADGRATEPKSNL